MKKKKVIFAICRECRRMTTPHEARMRRFNTNHCASGGELWRR